MSQNYEPFIVLIAAVVYFLAKGIKIVKGTCLKKVISSLIGPKIAVILFSHKYGQFAV